MFSTARYRSTRQVIDDLIQHGKAIVVDDEVDPYLEIAEIQRRVYQNHGPAILFTRVKNCQFPIASNIFGTLDRAKFLFRDTLDDVKAAIRFKVKPQEALNTPRKLLAATSVAWRMRPRRTTTGPAVANQCFMSRLPHITCWPGDGGAFITLPQVVSQRPKSNSLLECNLGMYRIQLNGNRYAPERECGLHYQIHRGIGVHHAQAIEQNQPFPVTITVGGSPAMTLAAVMPLPENLSELVFAGALAGYRIPMICQPGLAPIYADADFCITGLVDNTRLKPEGPFGDHLGYYAKVHGFPLLNVYRVYYREGAVWPTTVVGRPPQEDTTFGKLIHELTDPIIPTVLPGVEGVHAVDAAGVHPLLLAIGSERYTPYQRSARPQELLTQACAILGQGQLSLAKYLMIADRQAAENLNLHDEQEFIGHVLARADWQRDLHFHTRTTIDTLDYSGDGLNAGSKLVIAAAGPGRFELANSLPSQLPLPDGWKNPRVVQPGILAIEGPKYSSIEDQISLQRQCDKLSTSHPLCQFRLIVIVNDSHFTVRSMNNFLWVTFTRSNPASDVYGIEAFVDNKHFGCRGSLVIDARIKPHHAEPLVEDPQVTAKVDQRATRGGPLAKYL